MPKQKHQELEASILDTIIKQEVETQYSRSSWPGWQHVNKTESRVQLYRNLSDSVLPEPVKQRIQTKYQNKIDGEGKLTIVCQETRSKHSNLAIAVAKLKNMIELCLAEPKERKETQVPKNVKEKRLNDKRQKSKKLANRKTRFDD